MGFVTSDLLTWLLIMFYKVLTGRSHPVNFLGNDFGEIPPVCSEKKPVL